MDYEKTKEKIIEESPQKTDAGKWELYLYSLRRMAVDKVSEHKNSLTNLHDLKSFFFLAGEMIRENSSRKYGVIVMDISKFKAVNEFCGRSEGDRLLLYIGEGFGEYEEKRPLTFVSHARADIFCMCTAFEEEQELVDIVMNLKARIDKFPFVYRVLPSFGISTSVDLEPSISYLKDCATMALNSIKGKFYAPYAFFDDDMRKQLLKEKQVENDIVSAMEKGELTWYVQPKVNMRTGRIVGGEALIRWMHPEKGMIPPMDFIPVLEKNGFVINVDAYIWEQVFAYLSKLKKEKRQIVPISVNVSRMHVYDQFLCDTLLKLREEYEMPAQFVPLELTESAFLKDEEGMYSRMELLRSQGFSVSMDDFGTGYSTMNMLKNQTMDEIKIDRGFIMDFDNEKSQTIIRHTIDMLNELNVRIVIEGVETEQQRDFLLECGCEFAQGYLFYKPMPVEEFDALLLAQEEQDKKNGIVMS